MQLSPDGKHLVCHVETEDGTKLVIDGKPVEDVVGAWGVSFSADGKRMAYFAGKEQKYWAVVDGVAGEQFESVLGLPVFSDDGKHVAYVACVGDNATKLVVDGESTETFENMEIGELKFSEKNAIEFVAVRGEVLFRVRVECGVGAGTATKPAG
jgi:hypothetical protein